MRRSLVLSCLFLAGSMSFLATLSAVAVPPARTIFGVTTGNELVRFSSDTPGTILGSAPITGLAG